MIGASRGQIQRAGDASEGESEMLERTTVALFVDRTARQWVVRDPSGELWRLPSGNCSWDLREPFDLSEDTELEAVPGHYKYMLDLPF